MSSTRKSRPQAAPADNLEGLLTALSHIEEGVAVFDAAFRLVCWNPQFAALAGYPDNLLQVGETFETIIGATAPRDALALDSDTITSALRNGSTREHEITLSDERVLRGRFTPTSSGGAVVTWSEITQSHDAEEALRQSEERYALISEAAEEGVYDWRLDAHELYLSPRLIRFLGAGQTGSDPAAWHRLWNRRVHEDDLEHKQTALESHFESDTAQWACEYRFRNDQGEYRWILDHGYTVRADDGTATRLVGAIRDITQRKTAEADLLASEERYEVVMRAINEGVYDWDIASGAVDYTERIFDILDVPVAELRTASDWLERIHPQDQGTYLKLLMDHFKGKSERFECDFRYRGSSGNWRWARQHGIATRNAAGRAVRLIGSTGDITELKEHERELAEKTAILETTFENINQGITMVNNELRTIALNHKFLELLDFPPERFASGFHMADAFRFNAERGEYGPGDIDSQVRERLELAARFEPHEFERARPDGSVLAIRGQPIPGGGFVTTYTDITEQKRTENALRESEDRYALATQAATEGIYEWDLVQNTLYLSDRAKAFFAFDDRQLTPADWNARIHPEDMSGYRQSLVEHFKGETPHIEHEYRLRGSGDQYLWLQDHGIGVRDDGGRVVRVVGALSNITDRKEAEMELRRARDTAEAATQAKSAFLANMSHELRTPLNAIIGFTRLVMRRSKEVLEDKQYQNLEKIRVSAEHLLALINDILDLSKIEAERVEIEATEFELEPLLAESLRTIEPLVDADVTALELQLDGDIPTMYSDSDKLRQIILNLLGNAAKFTEQGSIRVRATCKRDQVRIAVTDTGAGIPADKLEHIFEEFGQVDDSSTRQHGGTGLGLAIGARLAQLLGGEITVSSAPGEGSTFTVILPLRYRANEQTP